ncbi:hypothetical protein [Nannocystis punicea]|uniref:MYXO-CTERM domain-containing protein n=1 Tax=Nannocystis punicea TaxID=2995304 RepID=A0ABY7HHR3_9BACT|nr:hypothetical protein [Nannocystis poenicansa]WAS98862.1 hypothetical protein O0S08_22255 [Nannocystis poenicansa]
MLRARPIIAPLVAVAPLLWAAAPSPARACEPDFPDTVAFPPSGSVLPRNAAVRITGFGANPNSAMVDGDVVNVVEVAELSGPEKTNGRATFPVGVFRVEPEPNIGAMVSFLIKGEPSLVYTAGLRDTNPPAPLTDLSVDLHDFLVPSCGDSCSNGNWTLNYWVHLVGGAQDDGSPVVHNIFLNDTGDDTDGELVFTIMAGSQQHVRLPREVAWAAENDPLHDVCITVRTFDTAMNEAPVAHRACKLCRAQLEPGEPPDECDVIGVTSEPTWTPADTVRDGACSAMQIPPLPAPPPDPDTTTGDDSTGGDSTGDDSTGGDSTGGDSTGSPPDGTTTSATSTSTTTTTTDPVPPTTTDPTETPTTGSEPPSTTDSNTSGDSSSSGTSAGGDGLVEHGCACTGAPCEGSTPALLLIGLFAVVLARPRRLRHEACRATGRRRRPRC